MTVHTYTELAAHIGHGPSVVTYADGANVALECCGEVLLDFDRPGDAAPGAGGQLWHDNSVQFPRLIAEMNAAGFFEADVPVIENKLELLTRSTDLDVDAVMELVNRAQAWWDRYLEARRQHDQATAERAAHPVDALSDEARLDLLRRIFNVLEHGDEGGAGAPGVEHDSDTTSALCQVFADAGITFTQTDA